MASEEKKRFRITGGPGDFDLAISLLKPAESPIRLNIQEEAGQESVEECFTVWGVIRHCGEDLEFILSHSGEMCGYIGGDPHLNGKAFVASRIKGKWSQIQLFEESRVRLLTKMKVT